VIGTDRERHQTSAVLIFQFIGKEIIFIVNQLNKKISFSHFSINVYNN